mmetsp:Transcript_15117/g.39085  ORF Transcript_15117/g.39085 Transcript_15117/m.39085 type:complete len:251 (+) Transcript_15117:677-1429(+)
MPRSPRCWPARMCLACTRMATRSTRCARAAWRSSRAPCPGRLLPPGALARASPALSTRRGSSRRRQTRSPSPPTGRSSSSSPAIPCFSTARAASARTRRPSRNGAPYPYGRALPRGSGGQDARGPAGCRWQATVWRTASSPGCHRSCAPPSPPRAQLSPTSLRSTPAASSRASRPRRPPPAAPSSTSTSSSPTRPGPPLRMTSRDTSPTRPPLSGRSRTGGRHPSRRHEALRRAATLGAQGHARTRMCPF